MSYTKLSIKSTHLLAKHATSMSNMLLYAKYLYDFEAHQDQEMVQKYKKMYLKVKENLRQELGDAAFAELIHDCMQASHTEPQKHFGILFYADAYCEPEFQHIADIANTVKLAALGNANKKPKKVTVVPNLFGSEREFVSTPLASGLGQILLPADPKKENTVYVICQNLAEWAEHPEQAIEAAVRQLQQQILKLNLPEEWKANIKVLGENNGAKIAEKIYTAIQHGLNNELVQQQALSLAQQVGLGGAVKTVNALGGPKALVNHIESLNFQNVQTSPLLSPAFRAANPAYNQALTNAYIPQTIGIAGLVLNEANNLGMDQVFKDADQKLQQYHRYRMIRPALAFVVKNAMPTLGTILTGAAIGSMVPVIGTGVGALIGAGVAVTKLIFQGYALWKTKKQESLKVAAAAQGIEIQSSFQGVNSVMSHQSSLRFSPSQSSMGHETELKKRAEKPSEERKAKKRHKPRLRQGRKPHLGD
jgi:hypothetical protein